ncbi:uncharacterized protein LOC142828105 [Pelodiscus sinensis]|uniref:uncharacterized protein LOC142828105 n=1 Tax=Pelodiscus sinensis TaxID=13735 RepID=UPI003F6C8374
MASARPECPDHRSGPQISQIHENFARRAMGKALEVIFCADGEPEEDTCESLAKKKRMADRPGTRPSRDQESMRIYETPEAEAKGLLNNKYEKLYKFLPEGNMWDGLKYFNTRSIVDSPALRYNRICSSPSGKDKPLQDLQDPYKYAPEEVREQIDRTRRVLRSLLLQDRLNEENNRTPLAITYSPQVKPLQHINSDLQPIPDNDLSLSHTSGGRPVLDHRQPANLKQILTSNYTLHRSNSNSGTNPCNKPQCQLCPHIYTSDTITGPNHISYTITSSSTCTSTNVIYAIMCQQCPSAMYIGQTGLSLCKRISGHKSDIRSGNTQKPIGEHFNLPGHTVADLKVAILQQNFNNKRERRTAEKQFIGKFDSIRLGLNKIK